MTRRITLYTRKDCCLCDEMKKVLDDLASEIPLRIEEIDVDGTPGLGEKYGSEVPLLFIDGRKAFKYRVTAGELKKRLKRDGI